MKRGYLILLAALAVLPLLGLPQYVLHILVQVLIWSFVYTSWSLMGRFGLVSLGHGAFLGVGAYTTALLWNLWGVPPWIGMLAGIVLAVGVAAIIAYPCSRLKVVGHYFALVTLALSEVVRLMIVAARDTTGGSLGMTLNPPAGNAILAFQFPDKRAFYYVALIAWAFGLWAWLRLDRSMARSALEAINEDETAAASLGIDVTWQKMRVTLVSAALTSFGGSLLGQYFLYLNPETLSGVGISLQIVFAAIAGGMYTAIGPTVGALFTIVLTEGLRILFGTSFIGAANTIYGLMLILFVIFMPRGIAGLVAGWTKPRPRATQPAAAE
jgi:branched-chain amino acid transport system permease protein